MLKVLLSTGVIVASCLMPTLSAAQCTNLIGNPAPTFEQYVPNFAKLKYKSNGPGFSDDQVILKKSTFGSLGFQFDPIATHTFHVTLRRNSISGPVMWSASIPPSALTWTQTNRGFNFSDPALLHNGVRRIKLFDYGGGSYIIKKFLAKDTNVTNAPLVPGTDVVHATFEMENAGVGVCWAGATYRCKGTGNSQRCS